MEDVLLDFSQLLVWKRAVCFLPREIVMLCGKKLSSSEIPEFHKGGPLQTSRSPCCVLIALSWNTTNEYLSTDKLSRAINYLQTGLEASPTNEK